MKLTTSNDFSKSKAMTKVATLKNLIQKAAHDSNSHSVTYNLTSNIRPLHEQLASQNNQAPKKKLVSSKLFSDESASSLKKINFENLKSKKENK